MCGRYAADLRWDDVAKLYDLSKQGPLPPWNFQPNYNVCPTDNVPVVIPNFDQRQLVVMRWGLIPNWWGKPKPEYQSKKDKRLKWTDAACCRFGCARK